MIGVNKQTLQSLLQLNKGTVLTMHCSLSFSAILLPNFMNRELFVQNESFTVDEFKKWRQIELATICKDIQALTGPIYGLDLQTSFTAISEELQQNPHSSSLLGEFPNSASVAQATTLNLITTLGHNRNSGLPYASHPELVGNIILKIAGDITPEQRLESKKLASLHDVIEEGPLRINKRPEEPVHNIMWVKKGTSDIQIVKESKRKIDSLFPENETGQSVVELMEPMIEESVLEQFTDFDSYIVLYSLFNRMLQRSQNPNVANVEIADRIDDECDLNYFFKKPISNEQKGKMLAGKLARCTHTVESLKVGPYGSDISEDLYTAFHLIQSDVIHTYKNLIDFDFYNERVSQFQAFFDNNIAWMDTTLDKYLYNVK